MYSQNQVLAPEKGDYLISIRQLSRNVQNKQQKVKKKIKLDVISGQTRMLVVSWNGRRAGDDSSHSNCPKMGDDLRRVTSLKVIPLHQ